MKRIGYIRPTHKSTTEEQSELLISSECLKLYIETSNNTFYKREKLNEAIEFLNNNDVLVVTRLSILSSTVQNLLDLIFSLQDQNITLEAIEQQFISTDEHTLDELLFYLSEFIEDIQQEKQFYGLQKAKSSGKRLGRPPKLTSQQVLKAIELKNILSSQQVANRFKVGRSTLLRHIAKHRDKKSA